MQELRAAIENELRQGVLSTATRIAASNQGEVHRLNLDDQALAVKTAAGAGLRSRVNQIALHREAEAYSRLEGVIGVPRCYGLMDRRWLVLDWVDARPYRDAQPGSEFFDQMLDMLRTMHQRGVAHSDLKRKANLMIDASNRPWIIDFGAAWLRRDGFHPVNQRLFKLMCQTDLNAWVKHKYGGYSDVPEPDRSLLRQTGIERLLRYLRR